MLLVVLLAVAAPDLSADASREVARMECRAPAEKDEVLVCGRRDTQRRYQVTDPDAPFDPAGNVDSVASERGKWIAEGDTGPGSCGPVGPGGWTGCKLKEWRKIRQQQGFYQTN
jgi:hypothetical protein